MRKWRIRAKGPGFRFRIKHKVPQPMDKTIKSQPDTVVGSVMVVGGGIAGMQAALDLADSGYKVYLLEKNPAIGGVMAQLDKTFPTNDCSM
jgi:heterodisulfide reductase subunit A